MFICFKSYQMICLCFLCCGEVCETDKLCKEPQTAAEVPAHIVMDDMSSWLQARSSNTLWEQQPRDKIKGDEDPANLTGELNILMCQEDGAGPSPDAQLVEKQTTSLMRLDMTLAATHPHPHLAHSASQWSRKKKRSQYCWRASSGLMRWSFIWSPGPFWCSGHRSKAHSLWVTLPTCWTWADKTIPLWSERDVMTDGVNMSL